MGFWLLAALCLGLLAFLWWTLSELYRLKLAQDMPHSSPVTRKPSEQFDQLLTMLLALHEYGVSRT